MKDLPSELGALIAEVANRGHRLGSLGQHWGGHWTVTIETPGTHSLICMTTVNGNTAEGALRAALLTAERKRRDLELEELVG